jgi:hypothetical protein
MSAEIGIALVGLEHHRDGVPAHKRADAVLERVVAGRTDFLVGGNRVDVGGVARVRHVDARGARELDLLLDQVMRALRAFLLDDGRQRIEPFLGLLGVDVGLRGYRGHSGHGLALLRLLRRHETI